jgi:hypothetical protein
MSRPASREGMHAWLASRAFLLFLTPMILRAQVGSTGIILGKVMDAETKLPIKGVTALVKELSRSEVTDTNGKFVVRSLPIKSYTLSIIKEGYEQRTLIVNALEPQEAPEIELQLQPSSYSRRIVGRVVDAESESPLPNVNVWLTGTLIGTSSDSSGRFVIDKLSRGTYALEVSHLGYKRKVIRDVILESDISYEIEVRLEPEPVKLSEIVVTPGTFSISSLQDTHFQLSKEEIRLTPLGIDDPLRALQLLPGTNSDYLNAKIGIRGSRPEDALYIIDGMEIFGSIFHMDRLQGSRTAEMNGLISILNTEIIDDLYLSLGGFTSKYGNKSGGIVAIKTMSVESPGLHGNLTLDIAKMAGLLSGRFGNSSFILSAARGYFDLVFGLFGKNTNLRPYYYDLFGKYEYKLPSGRIFIEALHALDWIDITESPSSEKVVSRAHYSLNHLWAGIEFVPHPSVLSSTILYSSFFPEKTSYDASAQSELDFLNYEKRALLYGIKQTLVYDISPMHSIEGGISAKYTRARYSFYQTYQETPSDSAKIVTSEQLPQGFDLGAYALYKTKPFGDWIVIDGGLRFDYQSYILNGSHQFSPRFGMSLSLPYQTVLRAGTGLYFQPTDIANIYNYTSQGPQVSRSYHFLLSLENRSIPGSEFRVEGYYKRLAPEIRGLFRYGHFSSAEYGYSYGVDVFAKKQFDRWFFWFGYSYGMARDKVEELVIYRSADRRHSLSANTYLSMVGGWNLSVNFRYATGRPYTEKFFEKVTTDSGTHWIVFNGFPRGSRGTNFSQLNISISKSSDIGWGKLSWRVQFLNVLNTQGIVTHKWKFVRDQKGEIMPVQDNNVDMPFLITFGLKWDF